MWLVLLPRDPDASARALREALCSTGEGPLGVVVSDTFGRPWREGQVDVALGCAGFAPICDQRGQVDRSGRALQAPHPTNCTPIGSERFRRWTIKSLSFL